MNNTRIIYINIQMYNVGIIYICNPLPSPSPILGTIELKKVRFTTVGSVGCLIFLVEVRRGRRPVRLGYSGLDNWPMAG